MAQPSKNPTLAIIVVAILAVILIVFFVQMRGHHNPPDGGPSAPVAGNPSNLVVQNSTVPNEQQPSSTENGASGHRGQPDEPGGPAVTANTVGRSS